MNAPYYQLPVFPFRQPPELQGELPGPYPAVVVGGGLTGLVLACDLVQRGVPVVLLDEDDTIGVQGASSRGIVYAQRSLEILHRLGVFDRIDARGVAWSVGQSLVEDEVVYGFNAAERSVSHQPPFLNVQQFYVEWALVDQLATMPGADVRWKSRVTSVAPDSDGVVLEVETPAGPYRLRAGWVLDCSGVGSPIRAALDLPANRARSDEVWCIADVKFEKNLPAERWTWIKSRANGGLAVWQHPMANGVWRIDFQMAPGTDPAMAANPEICNARLDALLGSDTKRELVWIGPWRSTTHLLDSFRAGRILFAGDSAHSFPPFGARGGNSGIQDADNLGWKLASVLAGAAPDTLLDSYDAERRAAAVDNIRISTRSLRYMSPKSEYEELLRDCTIELAREFPFGRTLVNTGRLSSAACYAGSPLTVSGGGAVPNVRVRTAGGETWLFDLLRGHPVFVLLAKPRHPLLQTSVPGVVAAAVVALPGQDETIGALFDGASAVLVRPDGHVVAHVSAPEDAVLLRLMGQALGRGGALEG